MSKKSQSMVESARVLGFRPANGTETGARGFTIKTCYGKTQFFSFELMCFFMTTVIRSKKSSSIMKNISSGFSYSFDETGGMCIDFDRIGRFYFNADMIEGARKRAQDLNNTYFLDLVYAKNKNTRKGSYIRTNGYHFWSSSSSSITLVSRKIQ